MPPRIPSPLSGLCRRVCMPQSQSTSFSTSSRTSALKSLPTSQSSLLGLDKPASSAPSSETHDPLVSMLRSSRRAAAAEKKQLSMTEELRARTQADQYSRHMTRVWHAGDVYAPHDLSPSEMRKWGRRRTPQRDVMDLLGVNPLDMYKNFSLISEFITPFGRIKHSTETGLRPVNQRKMAKTIRRAIGLGLHPSVYKHPMILLKESPNAKSRLT